MLNTSIKRHSAISNTQHTLAVHLSITSYLHISLLHHGPQLFKVKYICSYLAIRKTSLPRVQTCFHNCGCALLHLTCLW